MSDLSIPKAQSQFGAVWRQFRIHRGAVFGLIVLGILVGFVVFGPFFWPEVKLKVVEALKVKNQGPSLRFPFGTDQLGRDILVRMMAAGKVSLAVGFVAMMIAIFVGTGVGILAGYFKQLDGPLMRLTDLFLSLPLIPLLLVLVMLFRDKIAAIMGPELGAFLLIVFAIGITSWMQAARIVRGEEREYVLAAKSIGVPARRVILRHILPNIISPVMVAATLGVAEAIITESVLSFLGLGFPPDFPTWGRLLFDGLNYLQLYPERVIWPGLAISLTVLSVNYIGDGLRDALDPRIRGR